MLAQLDKDTIRINPPPNVSNIEHFQLLMRVLIHEVQRTGLSEEQAVGWFQEVFKLTAKKENDEQSDRETES